MMDKPKPSFSKIEVVIPTRYIYESTADSIQKAKDYMMGNDPSSYKRKRTVIADSDDDDLSLSHTSPNPGRTQNDEKIARQLQEELDRETAEAVEAQNALVSDDGGNDGHDDDQQYAVAASDSEDYALADVKGKGKALATSDSEDYPMASRKGKGKAVETRRPRTSRAAAKKFTVIADSDEESDDGDYSDPGSVKPPAKKRKITVVSRRKTPAKNKQLLSDDDVPGKLQTLPS